MNSPKPLKLLLTNDDGYHAPGIQALAAGLASQGHSVWVLAPAQNQSGVSCALSIQKDLRLVKQSDTHYTLGGTPADCVHVALTGLAQAGNFDAVISGINDGANLGDDAIHSGTLGAATQAHLYGLPALASSLVDRGWAGLDAAVQITEQALYGLLAQTTPSLWNLNVPNHARVPAKDGAPFYQFTSVGRRTPSYPVIEKNEPIVGGEEGLRVFRLGSGGDTLPLAGNDMALVAQGYASISPITLDRTDYAALLNLQGAHTVKRTP